MHTFRLELDPKDDSLIQVNKKWSKGRVYVQLDAASRKVIPFISVTNFLKQTKTPEDMEWLDRWQQRVGPEEAKKQAKRASTRGTMLHGMYEDFLLNKPLRECTIPEAQFQFNQLHKELEEHITCVRGSEMHMHSTRLQVAGTADGVVDWDGELAILDFKTSTKQKRREYITDYFLQCLLYAIMYEEMYDKLPRKLVIVISSTNGDSEIFVADIQEFIPILAARYKRALDWNLFKELPDFDYEEIVDEYMRLQKNDATSSDKA